MENLDSKEIALTLFSDGFNCAQAVLTAFSDKFNLNEDLALKIAGAFGGGMGRMGEVCGAVTGAFMVLGLEFPFVDSTDKEAKEKLYQLVQEFTHKFKSHHNSIKCKELLGVDLNTEEGRKEAKEKDLHNTLCQKFILTSVVLLEGMIK
ncbi:MAG: C-GCAxxG-C-C family protein [Ignavibacteria bacterium]|nr:C-GCAxxG-C-C family protein [Ignavibacteria bacterium]